MAEDPLDSPIVRIPLIPASASATTQRIRHARVLRRYKGPRNSVVRLLDLRRARFRLGLVDQLKAVRTPLAESDAESDAAPTRR